MSTFRRRRTMSGHARAPGRGSNRAADSDEALQMIRRSPITPSPPRKRGSRASARYRDPGFPPSRE
jgi:hypothetical protein